MKYSPYSFSKQDTYFSCPRKFKYQYIDKIKGVSDNRALEKGSYIHEKLENFIMCVDEPPFETFIFKLLNKEEQKECEQIVKDVIETDFYKKIKQMGEKYKILVEEGFSLVGKNWEPNIYSPKDVDEVIYKGKIDLIILSGKKAICIDHKTGKYKELQYQSYEQVMLYCIYIFKKYPQIEEIKCFYSYVEHDKRNEKVITRDELQKMEKHFKDKLQKIENDSKFDKNVTKLCNWCNFRHKFCDLTDAELMKII